MLIIALWFVLAIMVGAAAGARGRSGFGWFLLAMLISPLIAGLIIAVLPDLKTRGMLERLVKVHAVDDHALALAAEARRRDTTAARGGGPQLGLGAAIAIVSTIAAAVICVYLAGPDTIAAWLHAHGIG